MNLFDFALQNKSLQSCKPCLLFDWCLMNTKEPVWEKKWQRFTSTHSLVNCYNAPVASALQLLLRSRSRNYALLMQLCFPCHCTPDSTALPIALCSQCHCALAVFVVLMPMCSRCYCAPANIAVPLLLRSICYCGPDDTTLPLLLRSRCYCAPAATALPLLLRSRCYCPPAKKVDRKTALCWIDVNRNRFLSY